jgi:uncharacterized protein (TIGR00299 family) protein
MTMGALLDAGADLNFVVATLKQLNIDGWALSAERVERKGIDATRAIVDAPEQHHHRHWSDIRKILESSSLPDRVKTRSLAVFETLAIAEGKVHGIPAEDVHFHEVGALDAIVDIVGSCAALESLDIDEIASGPVAVGVGTITAAHGVLPNPPPAVVNLLEQIPTVGVDVDLELTTPTGAAIIKALATGVGAMPDMTIRCSGYGAGSRDLSDRANVTQVIIGSLTPAAAQSSDETETVIELLAAGALDAWVTPIVMKKNRPAHTLSVLSHPNQATELTGLVMSLTGTLGVRSRQLDRVTAKRTTVTVSVDGHDIGVKISDIRIKAEFDDVAAAATALGLPVQEVAARAEALAGDL